MKTATIMLAGILALAVAAHAAEFHVAVGGKDSSADSQAVPFRTIQYAADLAQPGDVITVHEGVYREHIAPPRGGLSDAKRIVYQTAPGEKVEILGSEVVKNWAKVQDDVWKANVPNSLFGGFNPYSNLIRGEWFTEPGKSNVRRRGAAKSRKWPSSRVSGGDITFTGSSSPKGREHHTGAVYLIRDYGNRSAHAQSLVTGANE